MNAAALTFAKEDKVMGMLVGKLHKRCCYSLLFGVLCGGLVSPVFADGLISIEPSTAAPNENGIVRFSVVVAGVPATRRGSPVSAGGCRPVRESRRWHALPRRRGRRPGSGSGLRPRRGPQQRRGPARATARRRGSPRAPTPRLAHAGRAHASAPTRTCARHGGLR